MTNGFALNYAKSLQIYLNCQARNNFPKDVEMIVDQMLQNAVATDQCLHFLQFSLHFLYPSSDSQMDDQILGLVW